jgi:hypothetical protein
MSKTKNQKKVKKVTYKVEYPQIVGDCIFCGGPVGDASTNYSCYFCGAI